MCSRSPASKNHSPTHSQETTQMKSNHRQGKYSDMAAMLLTMLVAVVMFAGAVVPAQSQTFTLLYSFQGPNENEGAYPLGLVQGTNGYLYGATAAGSVGELDGGTFFKISTSGKETIICSFYNVGPCRDAQAPSANLVLGTNGNFYGVDLVGEVFKITPGDKLTILYTNSNSISEASLVLASNGDFYGTTKNGGTYNEGTV